MEKEQAKYCKYCLVPQCQSTSIKYPEKVFVSLPVGSHVISKKKRKLWLRAMRRIENDISEKTKGYVCEDHFNFENDMKNYIKWKMMGGNIFLKEDVVPHIFECQVDRKRSFPLPEQNKLRMELDFIEPTNDTPEPSFSKIKIDQLVEEIVDSKYFVSNHIDGGEIWVPDFPNNRIEPANVKFEVNLTDSALPKLQSGQSENVVERNEEKCFEDQFTGTNGQIWDREEFLDISAVDSIKQEVEEDIDSNAINDSRCHLSNDSSTPEDQLKQHNIKNTHFKMIKDKCNSSSSRKGGVENLINGVRVKNHKCHICEYSTSVKGVLARHIKRVHMGVKNEKCIFCDFCTGYQAALKSHMDSIHLGIKGYKCHICEYSTGYQGSLKQHIDAVHLGIKSHKCKLCEYSTSRKDHLKKHVDHTHLGLKNHKCNFCEYSAGRKTTLKRHLNSVHLGIKNHTCHLCEYSTYHKPDLKKHVKGFHNGIKNHKCQFCAYSTDKKDVLKRHIDDVHLES